MALSEKELQNGQILQVVFFRPEFDNQVKDLDDAAGMGRFMGGLINFGRDVDFPYGSLIEHKGYLDGFILVARFRSTGQVVGKLAAGLKEVYLSGKPQKVGYLFDLRVPVKAQRMGIGRFLLEAAQVECYKRGVTVQLMSINKTNQKMMGLSRKLGWVQGCQRRIYMETPLNQGFRTSDQDPQIEMLTGNSCGDQSHDDLSLVKFKQLSDTNKYIGQLKVSSKDDSATLHIAKVDSEFGMVCKRLFLTPETWNKWHTWLIVGSMLLIGPILLIASSLKLHKATVQSKNMFIGGLISLIIAILILVILRYVIFYVTSPVIRIFGYQYKGRPQNENNMCQLLFREGRKFAGMSKCLLKLNEDLRAPYLQWMKDHFRGLGRLVFVYKCHDPTASKEPFGVSNFFDPRDL